MKKLFLSFAVCALALSACTSEDVINEGPQSNAITFKNVVDKNVRALTSETLSQFYVFGYYTKGADLNTRFSIFTDTPVTKSGDTWSSSISRYWVKDATYSFYAFSCENKDIAAAYGGPSVGQNDGVFRINYTCHTDDDTSHDLVFASSTNVTGKEKDNDPVTLQFKHILSKISLRFVSDFPEGYEVQISNISISDFENKGTFTASKNGHSEGSWGAVEYDDKNAKSFSLNALGSDITGSGKDLSGKDYVPVETSSCYMIPNNYNAGVGGDNPVKIKFDIRLLNPSLAETNQTILSNTLSGYWHPQWRQGTQYVYTIHISGNEAGMDKIDFNVGVSDWNDPTSDNNPQKINIALDYMIE